MDYIIIVAGGRGTRMGTDTPKQFLKAAGKPVLMHTIERFHHYDPQLGIIVVLPKDQQETWKALCTEHHFDIPHRIADGGQTRFESSKNGLALVPDDEEGVVGFHDGVRPFVSEQVIANCFEMAREEYTAVPVVPVTDTLRHTDPRSERTFTVDRKALGFYDESRGQWTAEPGAFEALVGTSSAQISSKVKFTLAE